MGVIKGDTRSLDSGSFVLEKCTLPHLPEKRGAPKGV